MAHIASKDLIDGELYFIDAEFNNGGIVKLIWHGLHFCEVEDPDTGHTWDTMTYRLSEIQQNT